MEDKVNNIEVFQDLFLKFSEERRMEICGMLTRHAKAPWHHAKEREKKFLEYDTEKYVMTFERNPSEGLPASSLILWPEEYGYQVSNIIPLKTNKLEIPVYNNILNDFLNRIIRPASEEMKFDFEISSRNQSITDWVSQEAAEALHRFSVTANKSTGSSHPSDQRFWFEFLFAIHKESRKFNTDILGRWLREIEEWPPEVVDDLIIEYEFGMDLLEAYDLHIE